MNKKADLINIYETYQRGIVEELNIGVPSEGPSLFPSSEAGPSNQHTVNLEVQDEAEENCQACGKSPCGCSECSEDSNLEMAKSEVFKIAKSSQELLALLSTATELEPWQLSKLVKASDYVCSVKGSLEYDEYEKCKQDLHQGMNDLHDGMGVVGRIKDMLEGEDMSVNEKVLRHVIFNIECLKEANNK